MQRIVVAAVLALAPAAALAEQDAKLELGKETAVTQGVDVMPSYAELLTDEEIEAVAHCVSTVAGADGTD